LGTLWWVLLYKGINHFLNRAMLTEYARSKQVPAAHVAVPASGTLLLLGGLSLLTGTRPKVGASLITAFLLGVTPQMHAFWKIGDEERRTQELVNFSKNVALIGAARTCHRRSRTRPGSVHVGSRALLAT
jgi:putative oxidoreductase